MPNFAHIYRCRCANWTDNQVKVFTTDQAAPFDRLQHFQLREGVGQNDTCQNYLSYVRTVPHTGPIPEPAKIKPKPAVRVTDSRLIAGVQFGPTLLHHVFKGELNSGTATGYHSIQNTNQAGGFPLTITGAAHRLAAMETISRPDEFGIYYVRIKFDYMEGNQRKTTAWKISTMFCDRLSEAAIIQFIKTAYVNPRTEGSRSVNWAGLTDNNLRIGGRFEEGVIKSAFPAYKGSFAIPDYVTYRFNL
jgi:hypothetical protein